MKSKKLIGLVGTNGSGKSTVCQILKEKKFLVISLSDYVREEVKQRALSQTRDAMIKIANQLKDENGQNFLAKKAFSFFTQQNTSLVVFDSIRNEEEVSYLKSKEVVLWSVDATLEKRYERIQQRQRASDLIDFNTFVEHDRLEMTGASSGQNIEQAIFHCNYKINNNGSLTDLTDQVDQLLSYPLWNNGITDAPAIV